ncbi:ergosterol biosynthesis protein [Pleosporales sp. CAS-2024a]
MASTLTSLLPPTPGLLPQWLFFTALISIGNSIQAYSTLKLTSRVYNPTPIDPPPTTPKHVTALSSRLFGTWTFLASVIRIYAAYNVENPVA